MVCCIATWAMTPAAPASSAGFVATDAGVLTNSRMLEILPLSVTMARLTPSEEPFITVPRSSAAADFSVSFTQRPA